MHSFSASDLTIVAHGEVRSNL